MSADEKEIGAGEIKAVVMSSANSSKENNNNDNNRGVFFTDSKHTS